MLRLRLGMPIRCQNQPGDEIAFQYTRGPGHVSRLDRTVTFQNVFRPGEWPSKRQVVKLTHF